MFLTGKAHFIEHFKCSSVRRFRVWIWLFSSGRRLLSISWSIQKMPSNEELLIIMRLQINVDRDKKSSRDRLFGRLPPVTLYDKYQYRRWRVISRWVFVFWYCYKFHKWYKSWHIRHLLGIQQHWEYFTVCTHTFRITTFVIHISCWWLKDTTKSLA